MNYEKKMIRQSEEPNNPSSIRLRLIKRFTVLFIILFFFVQGIVLYNFRTMSIKASQDKAGSAAGLIRDTITSYMVLGVINKRDLFLKNIKQTQGIKEIKILRGDPVIGQFGPPREMEKATTPMEKAVLRTGHVEENLNETLDEVEYTLIIPYRASREGKINCMQCHNVEENEVLGAVSITMDLTEERSIWFRTLTVMSLVSLLFFIGILYMIVVFFKPYTDFFSSLRNSFKAMEEGDLTQFVHIDLNDEAGSVADSFNLTMNRLSRTLSGIRVKVALLIGHPVYTTGNALRDTAEMVDELVKIYNFKRTIEQDNNILEIYTRIERILKEMGINYYSIYDVDQEKKSLHPVKTAGLNGSDATQKNLSWCNPVVTDNHLECRARRTGADVTSDGFPEICPNFVSDSKSGIHLSHYCIPFYIGGQVGGIIQIVHTDEERQKIKSELHFLKSYLQEAAPVIEAKTYMELLKEQSLKDQLTGLYNRRFLDEYVQNMVNRAKGADQTVGILMIDLDFFKKVNDEYGHNIGDKVIKGVSRLISGVLRGTDIIVRYGGEEILAILIDIKEAYSEEIAEKIRSRVENTTIVASPHRIQKTVSIGVAEFPIDGETFNQCLKYADMALYRAKEEGRNRTVRYNPDIAPLSKKQEFSSRGYNSTSTEDGIQTHKQ